MYVPSDLPYKCTITSSTAGILVLSLRAGKVNLSGTALCVLGQNMYM